MYSALLVGAGILIIILVVMFHFRMLLYRHTQLVKKKDSIPPPVEDGNLEKLQELTSKLEKRDSALYKSDFRFKAVADIAFCGIFIHKDGVVAFANETFAELVGLSVGEVVGRDCMDWVHTEDVFKVENHIQQNTQRAIHIRLKTFRGVYERVRTRGQNIYYPGIGDCRIVAVAEL